MYLCGRRSKYAFYTRSNLEEVDEKLKQIMKDIHESCVVYGKNEDGSVDYIKGANIAGFVKVADAMLAQGIV